MGFATSITVSIFFIGFVITFSVAYPLIIHSYNDIQDSVRERQDLQLDRINTHIGYSSSVSAGGIINITLSNDGSTALHAGLSDVLLDGAYTTYSVNPSGLWLPGSNAKFTLSANTSMTHSIKIITENGIALYKEV